MVTCKLLFLTTDIPTVIGKIIELSGEDSRVWMYPETRVTRALMTVKDDDDIHITFMFPICWTQC